MRHTLACTRLALAVATAAACAPAARADTLAVGKVLAISHDGVDRARLRRVANRASADVAMVDAFLGRAGDGLPVIRLHVYPSLESKGLATGYTLPAHAFSARNEVYVADEDGFEGDMTVELATIVMRRRLGRPRTDALEEGLATLLADDWRGRGALYWAARLAAFDDVRTSRVFTDNRTFHSQSGLVMRPLAAAFVAFLMDDMGKTAFLRAYAAWQPAARGAGDDLDARWARYLDRLRSRTPPAPRRDREIPAFQRGFCLAHEGYQIDNGYLSKKSDDALERLASLGTNAVSITPFTYMRSPRHPSPLPFSNGPGSENDESIVHAARAARRRGMCVMLKPHVWLGGGWSGDIAMENDADWDAFFRYYTEWMRHYALMAEMLDVDVLCVGTELGGTTRAHPERWTAMIDQIRTVYRGRLTYAANWGDEFENATLWPALDYIGVNCYYPLSDSENASDEDLARGVGAALATIDAVARRCGKPVVITEVGFTSTPAPWVAPYERPRRAGVDLEAQARCYEAFFRGLAGREDIAGVYWWKWPSFLEYGGSRDDGFTPNGKPAEDVVRRWYGAASAR